MIPNPHDFLWLAYFIPKRHPQKNWLHSENGIKGCRTQRKFSAYAGGLILHPFLFLPSTEVWERKITCLTTLVCSLPPETIYELLRALLSTLPPAFSQQKPCWYQALVGFFLKPWKHRWYWIIYDFKR
jgi:hypothetical protein